MKKLIILLLTQFKKKGGKLEPIIRDADLMQVFEYNWIHQNIMGLSTELNIDFLDFIKPQRKFLDSVEFTTNWGKKMKQNHWKNVVEQYEMLERACGVKLKSSEN